ncbi:hypothetical protein HMPREF9413_4169 [Paenibacillus sp. HGF7]|nr:hypothetical protein HMPREF9413_4169 [Paenibacillus sp. HGF7]
MSCKGFIRLAVVSDEVAYFIGGSGLPSGCSRTWARTWTRAWIRAWIRARTWVRAGTRIGTWTWAGTRCRVLRFFPQRSHVRRLPTVQGSMRLQAFIRNTVVGNKIFRFVSRVRRPLGGRSR